MSQDPGFFEGISKLDNILREIKKQNEQTNQLLAQIAEAGGLNVDSTAQSDNIGGSLANTLALREGWVYDNYDVRGEMYDPGESFEIATENPGFVFFAIVNAVGEGAEETAVTIKTDSSVIDTTIKERYLSGLHTPQEYLPFVPLYDTQNDSYSIAFYATDGYQFKDGFLFSADIPASAPGSIELNLAVSQAVIEDVESFLEVDL